jgi:hypothetical protein
VGKSANILIREFDDPQLVSQQFALKYGLTEQLREILEEQIRFNMNKVIKSQAASKKRP